MSSITDLLPQNETLENVLRDDEVQELIVDNYGNKLVRIGCLQNGGSGFLHATIKSFSTSYNECKNNIKYKLDVVKTFRTALDAVTIQDIPSEMKEEKRTSYYNILDNGAFRFLADRYVKISGLVNRGKIGFSWSELDENLLSNEIFFTQLFNHTSTILGLNIFFVKLIRDSEGKQVIEQILMSKPTRKKYRNSAIIMPLNNWTNYELIGEVRENNIIHTLFDITNSKLISELTKL